MSSARYRPGTKEYGCCRTACSGVIPEAGRSVDELAGVDDAHLQPRVERAAVERIEEPSYAARRDRPSGAREGGTSA